MKGQYKIAFIEDWEKKELNSGGDLALKMKLVFPLICNIYNSNCQIGFAMQILFTFCHCHLSVLITIS